MIDFASKKFSNPRIDYRAGELTANPSPFGEMKFNKIFSLYTLCWIENFREELKALEEQLKPSGEMFISMILDAHFFELFKKLKNHEKWGEIAKSHLVIPKRLIETGENSDIVRKVLENLGLEVKYIEGGEKSYVFENPAECANLLYSMNSFAKYLPEDEQRDLNELYYKFILETETKTHVPHPVA